jgi:hypothetical protein
MKGRKIAGIVICIYVIFLVVCSASWIWQLSSGDLFASLTHSVRLEEGSFKEDITELTVVLHEGETEKLSGFTALRSADFRGSDCIEEIYTWAQAHPDISVSYDFTLPNGETCDNTTQLADFIGINHDNITEYTGFIKYMPELAAVTLGSDDGSDNAMTAEDLSAFVSDYPDLRISYSFEVGGMNVSLDTEELDLSKLNGEQLKEFYTWLPCMTKLSSIELGTQADSSLTWDDIATLTETCPNVDISYSFTLYGKEFTLADETIDLHEVQIDDNADAVVEALPALYKCKTLDMDDGGVVQGLGNERYAEIREMFPDIDVVWRIYFGTLYSVRTDTERILASKPTVGGVLDDVECDKLAYCTKVKYLDLGHNENIYSIGFVSSMPDLEVFIIAMNPVSDLSPLASCTKLEYLEIFTTNVTDLSPLSGLTSLRHLNIANLPYLTDISPLYGLTELERLWIGQKTPIPADQVAAMQAAAPNCTINTTTSDEGGEQWKEIWYDENNATHHWVERYQKLREQLGYDYQEYSFYWLDPKCDAAAPEEYAGTYYGKTDG